MPAENRERRRDQRYFFTLKQGIATTLIPREKPGDSIPATLMSVSGGGISLFMDRKYLDDIRRGDRFLLETDGDSEPLALLKGAVVQILHIQNVHIYVHICCGCKFTQINEKNREKINHWIHYHFKENTRTTH